MCTACPRGKVSVVHVFSLLQSLSLRQFSSPLIQVVSRRRCSLLWLSDIYSLLSCLHTPGKTKTRCHPQSTRNTFFLLPLTLPLPLQATPLRHSGISQIVLVCHLCRCFSLPGGCHHRAWSYWPRPLPTTCPNLETRPAMLMGRFTARAHTASLPPKVIKNPGIRKSLRCRSSTINTTTPAQRTAKPPVISIKSWLERYARMVAVLVSCSPEKAP